VILALIAAPLTHAASITYTIQSYAALQNGYSLSGSITTDGTIGTLTGTDITAWSYTITKGAFIYQDSTLNPGAFASASNLTASSTSLTLAPAPPNSGIELASITGDSTTTNYLIWDRVGTNLPSPNDSYGAGVDSVVGSVTYWQESSNNNGLSLGGSTWIIATATTAVPEPGTLTLASLGIACLAAAEWARRRSSATASHPLTSPPVHS
jgi:PEP-CTERM motif